MYVLVKIMDVIRRRQFGVMIACWELYSSCMLGFYRKGNFCIALFCSERVKICRLRVKVFSFFQIIFESFEKMGSKTNETNEWDVYMIYKQKLY